MPSWSWATSALAAGVLLVAGCGEQPPDRISAVATAAGETSLGPLVPAIPAVARPGPVRAPHIRWRASRAIGRPFRGRLKGGVRLPAGHPDFFTWDGPLNRFPNRPWRRYGTKRLIRTILWIAARYRAEHPGSARLGVGDLSRPRGGFFGARYGGLGHASHQNGLDVDVYYPRRDGRERPPRVVGDVDRRLAQTLVDLCVQANATFCFVGQHVGLKGPKRVVRAMPHHDDHVHVRIP